MADGGGLHRLSSVNLDQKRNFDGFSDFNSLEHSTNSSGSTSFNNGDSRIGLGSQEISNFGSRQQPIGDSATSKMQNGPVSVRFSQNGNSSSLPQFRLVNDDGRDRKSGNVRFSPPTNKRLANLPATSSPGMRPDIDLSNQTSQNLETAIKQEGLVGNLNSARYSDQNSVAVTSSNVIRQPLNHEIKRSLTPVRISVTCSFFVIFVIIVPTYWYIIDYLNLL